MLNGQSIFLFRVPLRSTNKHVEYINHINISTRGNGDPKFLEYIPSSDGKVSRNVSIFFGTELCEIIKHVPTCWLHLFPTVDCTYSQKFPTLTPSC